MTIFLTKLKQFFTNKIWTRLLTTIIIIELCDDFIFSPLLKSLFSHEFWTANILYKVMELAIAVTLNVAFLKADFFLNWPTKPYHRKRIITITLLLAYFVLSLSLAHPHRLLAGLTVGLIAAIPEEFIWRGLVLGYLGQHLHGSDHSRAIRAWLISSLLFGLYHSGNIHSQTWDSTLSQVVQTVGLGLILGACYLKSGNLLNSMLVHFFWDFFVTMAHGIGGAQENTVNWGITIIIASLLSFIGFLILNSDGLKVGLIQKLSADS